MLPPTKPKESRTSSAIRQEARLLVGGLRCWSDFLLVQVVGWTLRAQLVVNCWLGLLGGGILSETLHLSICLSQLLALLVGPLGLVDLAGGITLLLGLLAASHAHFHLSVWEGLKGNIISTSITNLQGVQRDQSAGIDWCLESRSVW